MKKKKRIKFTIYLASIFLVSLSFFNIASADSTVFFSACSKGSSCTDVPWNYYDPTVGQSTESRNLIESANNNSKQKIEDDCNVSGGTFFFGIQCKDLTEAQKNEAVQKAEAFAKNKIEIQVQGEKEARAKQAAALESYGALGIPKCLFETTLSSRCRDVNIFLVFAINVVNYLFSIVGGLALLMFVYGGFMWIISSGNSEKIGEGTEAIKAAVIGLIIAFSGYMLVTFLGKSIQLRTDLQVDAPAASTAVPAAAASK